MAALRGNRIIAIGPCVENVLAFEFLLVETDACVFQRTRLCSNEEFNHSGGVGPPCIALSGLLLEKSQATQSEEYFESQVKGTIQTS